MPVPQEAVASVELVLGCDHWHGRGGKAIADVLGRVAGDDGAELLQLVLWNLDNGKRTYSIATERVDGVADLHNGRSKCCVGRSIGHGDVKMLKKNYGVVDDGLVCGC